MVETKGRNTTKAEFAGSRTFSELMEHTEMPGKQGRLGDHSASSGMCWERPGTGLYPVQKIQERRRSGGGEHSMLTKGFMVKTEHECGILWNHGYTREERREAEKLWDHSCYSTWSGQTLV